MSDKTSYDFSFKLSGQIWQTAVDPQESLLIMEVRNSDIHQIEYKLLNLKSKEISTFNIDISDWWTTVQGLHFPVLLLEKYGNPEDPTKKSLILYQLESKSVLKKIDQFQVTEVRHDRLIGHEPGHQDQKKEVSLPGSGLKENKPESVGYPVYYAPGTSAYQTVFDFLQKQGPGIGCEYLEWGEYIIISYYERLGTKFDRKLLVLKGDHEICHEVQDEGMKGFASGAFFLLDNLLVFIKNGNQINGMEL